MAHTMQRPQGPSTFDKMKIGALTGAGVGLTIGFIFGSYSIMRGGAGPRGALSTLSQYMLSSAATFGFFLSIVSVIRNDTNQLEHVRQAYSSPLIRSRGEGLAQLRAKWELEKFQKRH